jgi:redox-sensitive bicupin YhaK (pirin superfamily)
MTTRTLSNVIESMATSDGAGVKLRRSLGSRQTLRADPFLMLDEFFSDDPRDYIAGFPPHPHRGFETVTYMLDGHMRHEDHLGNRGELTAGGVQWMTAGRGIIHSEMPQQAEGRMRGFQLWLNLPAREKMKPAAYQDISPTEIPAVTLPGGARAKVIAGTVASNGRAVHGPINGAKKNVSTDPLYLDIELPPNGRFEYALNPDYTALVYPYEGTLEVGPAGEARKLARQSMGVLSSGDSIEVGAGAEGARFLLLAARPLNEPIVQYGPFVMNTRAEIEQAIHDYQAGKLAEKPAERITNA